MPMASASRVGVGVSIPLIFADCKEQCNTDLCSLHKDMKLPNWQIGRMSDDKNGGPNYLRMWREYRRMTQEELASACIPPTTGSVISLLEEGERGLSLKWLRRLAPALKTRPGWLADMNPENLDTRALEMLESVPADKREQIIQIIETFTGNGTEG